MNDRNYMIDGGLLGGSRKMCVFHRVLGDYHAAYGRRERRLGSCKRNFMGWMMHVVEQALSLRQSAFAATKIHQSIENLQ